MAIDIPTGVEEAAVIESMIVQIMKIKNYLKPYDLGQSCRGCRVIEAPAVEAGRSRITLAPFRTPAVSTNFGESRRYAMI